MYKKKLMSNLLYFRLEHLDRLNMYTLLLIVKHIMSVYDLIDVSIKMLTSNVIHQAFHHQEPTKKIQ